METKQEGNAEKFFKDFGKRLDAFMVEVKDASNRVEADLKLRFEELKTAADKMSKEASDKKRWQEVEEGLKRASKELENTFKSAFGKKS